MISIIVPLYNKESVILNTLTSIVSQDYQDWECVIVDDGSSDNSALVVKKFIEDDYRFSYYHKENGGPSSARNYGVKKAKYDWITFLDADDSFEPEALQHFNRLISTHHNINLFCCNFYIKEEGVKHIYSTSYSEGIIPNNFKAWYYKELMPCQGSSVFRKSLLIEHPFMETLRRFEDASMLFDVMRTERIFRSSQPTFTYVRDNSAASGVRKDFQEDFFAHLQPKGKPFWEQMILYQFYMASFKLYGEQAKQVYPSSPFHPCMEIVIRLQLRWIKIRNKLSNILSK